MHCVVCCTAWHSTAQHSMAQHTNHKTMHCLTCSRAVFSVARRAFSSDCLSTSCKSLSLLPFRLATCPCNLYTAWETQQSVKQTECDQYATTYSLKTLCTVENWLHCANAISKSMMWRRRISKAAFIKAPGCIGVTSHFRD